MARLVGAEFTDQAVAQQVEVADSVQHLVFDEFIFVAQAVFVKDAVVVHYNGVVHTAAFGQTFGAQVLDFVHKTKGTRSTYFFNKRCAGEVHRGLQRSTVKNRVIKFDGEGHFKAVKRNKAGGLVALFYYYGLFDADKFFRRILLLNTCRLNQEHKGAGAAIHNGNFRGADFDNSVVDAEAGHRREQVLYR